VHVTVDEMLDASFSMQSVSYRRKLVISSQKFLLSINFPHHEQTLVEYDFFFNILLRFKQPYEGYKYSKFGFLKIISREKYSGMDAKDKH
jgi:hypothetical protein